LNRIQKGIQEGIPVAAFAERTFNVLDYGAIADGQTGCRAAFAAAVQACHAAGGGSVLVPQGTYFLDGPIHLLSNVNLKLESADLLFSTDPQDYLPLVEVRWQGIRCMNYSPFIYANGQRNIAVTGSGVIDGQTLLYFETWEKPGRADFLILEQMAADGVPVAKRIFGPGYHLRPCLFEPYNCYNVLLQGVTLQNSPFWTIHPTFCANVVIENVTTNPGGVNDDGCDPESCQGVLIKGCTFTSNDDNMAIKAGRAVDLTHQDVCSGIVVQNCVCVGNWNAFSIGSQTDSAITDVFFEDCIAMNCTSAFYIKTDSTIGGSVTEVHVRGASIGTCHHVLFVQSDYIGVEDGDFPPALRDFSMDSVTCQDATVSAITLVGDPRAPIASVSVTNVAIQKAYTPYTISSATGVQSANLTLDGVPFSLPSSSTR
jgi:polygalacturonase